MHAEELLKKSLVGMEENRPKRQLRGISLSLGQSMPKVREAFKPLSSA